MQCSASRLLIAQVVDDVDILFKATNSQQIQRNAFGVGHQTLEIADSGSLLHLELKVGSRRFDQLYFKHRVVVVVVVVVVVDGGMDRKPIRAFHRYRGLGGQRCEGNEQSEVAGEGAAEPMAYSLTSSVLIYCMEISQCCKALRACGALLASVRIGVAVVYCCTIICEYNVVRAFHQQ
jgi:hypothetical protein